MKAKINIVSVNMISGCLIGLCVLILSYTHTTALFERAGYKGVFAHIGVIGFEMTFILGTITIIWSRWIGESVGIASRFVLILGVSVNLYSNITSGIAQNGKPLVFWTINKDWTINESVLIGAFIPLLIVAAEMVVNDALHKHHAAIKQNKTAQNEQTNESIEEISIRRTSPKREIAHNKQTEIAQEEQSSNTAKQEMEPIAHITEQTEESEQTERSEQTANTGSLIELAKRLMNQEGKLPSIRRLAEEANTTTYKARKVLDQLKVQTD